MDGEGKIFGKVREISDTCPEIKKPSRIFNMNSLTETPKKNHHTLFFGIHMQIGLQNTIVKKYVSKKQIRTQFTRIFSKFSENVHIF
jgi:hypothetical protein